MLENTAYHIVAQIVKDNPGASFAELCELLPDADTNDILAAGAPAFFDPISAYCERLYAASEARARLIPKQRK